MPPTIDAPGGLAPERAAALLAEHGPNELEGSERRPLWRTALEVVREPMFLMLIAAGALYLALGELGDAALLLFCVFVVVGITIVQERRTEGALDALRDLSDPRARVVRGGTVLVIPSREVVPGDRVLIAEGDRVCADGVLSAATELAIDESMLTGESVPVRKEAAAPGATLQAPGGESHRSAFAGTFVTSGQGVLEVVATGRNSEIGRIGAALVGLQQQPTGLQAETRRVVKVLAAVGLAACVVAVVAYAALRGGGVQVWKEGLLAGIAMAMALLPEEFPVVLTVFLALGARRIAQSRVLTRRMPAIEALGAATVLCVDKTGTLTENRMTVRAVMVGGASCALTEPPAIELLRVAALASRIDPFDPMEKALHAAAPGVDPGAVVREYALSSQLLAMSIARADGTVASKGAPEAIARLCRVDPAVLAGPLATLTDQGLRVLAVARGRCDPARLPDAHDGLTLELVGLVGFEDPLRPQVPAAVAECAAAGIRVVMITGDGPGTASAIARQAGLRDPGLVVTGGELAAITDAELAARIRTVSVFARIVPAQKLRIVTALIANGEVVAMTGDGVNDAPALKAAHIGIAMGLRGTDVAREAAALVLLDDDFGSIVAAIRLGRRIYDNVRKAVAFIVAVHVPIAGLSMLPVWVPSWPLLLFPVHIMFLELVIDPACALVFEDEAAEGDVMQRPPRAPGVRLFDARTVGWAVVQGATTLAACLLVMTLAREGHSPDVARSLTFVTLVTAFLVIILVNRSWTRTGIEMLGERNIALIGVFTGAIGVLSLALAVPAVRGLFHFALLHADDLALAIGAGVVAVAWVDAAKLGRRLLHSGR